MKRSSDSVLIRIVRRARRTASRSPEAMNRRTVLVETPRISAASAIETRRRVVLVIRAIRVLLGQRRSGWAPSLLQAQTCPPVAPPTCSPLSASRGPPLLPAPPHPRLPRPLPPPSSVPPAHQPHTPLSFAKRGGH